MTLTCRRVQAPWSFFLPAKFTVVHFSSPSTSSKVINHAHNHYPLPDLRPWGPSRVMRLLGGEIMGYMLLIVFLVLLLSSLPRWGNSRNWGYGPSGVLGLVFVILLVLLLTGYVPRSF